MSASRVVLWRHGQTDMNLTGRIQGARDFPLNDTGLRQAREAAAALAPLGPSLIVSSPLARARQTAEALSSLVGVDVEADDRLKERSFGLFEGLTGAEIEERFPEQYRAWRQAKEPEGVGAERQADVGLPFGAHALGFLGLPPSAVLLGEPLFDLRPGQPLEKSERTLLEAVVRFDVDSDE